MTGLWTVLIGSIAIGSTVGTLPAEVQAICDTPRTCAGCQAVSRDTPAWARAVQAFHTRRIQSTAARGLLAELGQVPAESWRADLGDLAAALGIDACLLATSPSGKTASGEPHPPADLSSAIRALTPALRACYTAHRDRFHGRLVVEVILPTGGLVELEVAEATMPVPAELHTCLSEAVAAAPWPAPVGDSIQWRKVLFFE